MKKKIMAALLCGAMMCSLSACRESERVAYNLSLIHISEPTRRS